ncbi:MAG: hypothetical protein EXS05_21675 [Planctomycetaceae bacterium]|nr:hypothetical protein [Planctomycetaceae bacterium]
MPSPRKPTAGFWIVVALVVLVGYPLSFGPACWITSRLGSTTGAEIVSRVYDPAIRGFSRCSKFVVNLAWWYSEVGAAEGWNWQFHHWHQLEGTESWIGPHE